MVQAYNFLASWQLFPEKCTYEHGAPPRSGIYQIEAVPGEAELLISINWVTLDNEVFYTRYSIQPDGLFHDFDKKELADEICTVITDSYHMHIRFSKAGTIVLEITLELLPNGYLKITQQGFTEKGPSYTNVEIYHKQLSVLPYASSLSGVSIKPTEEGVIKHQALQAMEEQTNMQLDQIRQQIELLARQAQEIRQRKELSMRIYNARISFQPVIGQVYHLYQKHDHHYLLSLISPKEWGNGGPFKQFIASVKLLADHTWTEVTP